MTAKPPTHKPIPRPPGSGAKPPESAAQPPQAAEEHSEYGGPAMFTLRYVLPAVVTLIGVVMMAMGGETNVLGGAGFVSAGLAIYLINWLFRAGASGDREREREDAAREYFDAHGRWPD